MEEYQVQYIQKLASRVEALDAAREALKDDPAEAGASARRMAHTLRGSGATYGFPQISELSAAVEDGSDDDLGENLQALILYLRFLLQKVKDKQESILIVDDSDEIQIMLGTILRTQGYEIFSAITAAKAREIMSERVVSLIILDLVLPDTDGRNYLVKLKEDFRSANIPVLVLSAKSSPQTKSECFALGADEYFEKPIDMTLLTTAISTNILKAKNIQQETRVDQLTGLPNRAAFNENFKQQKGLAKREGKALTLGVLDLDHFKQVNDRYGHLVGDEILKLFVFLTFGTDLHKI